jgi:hypothetical protein
MTKPKPEDDTTARNHALKRFTTEAIESEAQKKLLKKHKLIEYTHGFWHLSDFGKAEAIRLGYLDA